MHCSRSGGSPSRRGASIVEQAAGSRHERPSVLVRPHRTRRNWGRVDRLRLSCSGPSGRRGRARPRRRGARAPRQLVSSLRRDEIGELPRVASSRFRPPWRRRNACGRRNSGRHDDRWRRAIVLGASRCPGAAASSICAGRGDRGGDAARVEWIKFYVEGQPERVRARLGRTTVAEFALSLQPPLRFTTARVPPARRSQGTALAAGHLRPRLDWRRLLRHAGAGHPRAARDLALALGLYAWRCLAASGATVRCC